MSKTNFGSVFGDDYQTLKELKPKNRKQWLVAGIIGAVLLFFLIPLIKYLLITIMALSLLLPVYVLIKRRSE